MTIKVMANEVLFDRFKRLGNRLSAMASIVQNDTEISESELAEFHHLMNRISHQTEKLENAVGLYINQCNEESS